MKASTLGCCTQGRHHVSSQGRHPTLQVFQAIRLRYALHDVRSDSLKVYRRSSLTVSSRSTYVTVSFCSTKMRDEAQATQPYSALGLPSMRGKAPNRRFLIRRSQIAVSRFAFSHFAFASLCHIVVL